MQVFIDSSDPKEIRTARSWGILDGVTTNPTLISRGGSDMKETLRQVLDESPGPVLVQVIGGEDVDSLVGQARWLQAFSGGIVVKLPMSVAGIQAVQRLKHERSERKVAVTLVCSVAQAYLAARAGADIVALFNGPLEQAVDQDVDLVTPVRKVYQNCHFPTLILSCGRYPRSFGEFAAAGTDICTLRFEFLSLLFEHPFTDKRYHGFMADWQRVFGNATWPRTEG